MTNSNYQFSKPRYPGFAPPARAERGRRAGGTVVVCHGRAPVLVPSVAFTREIGDIYSTSAAGES